MSLKVGTGHGVDWRLTADVETSKTLPSSSSGESSVTFTVVAGQGKTRQAQSMSDVLRPQGGPKPLAPVLLNQPTLTSELAPSATLVVEDVHPGAVTIEPLRGSTIGLQDPPPHVRELLDAVKKFAPEIYVVTHPFYLHTVAEAEAAQARVQGLIENAAAALMAGNYSEAQTHLAALGLPLPPNGATISSDLVHTAIVLGEVQIEKGADGKYTGRVPFAQRGMQALEGMARYAVMMSELEASGIQGLNTMPTESQARAFIASVAGTYPRSSLEVMQATGRLIDGLMVHSRRVGGGDVVYNANSERFFVVHGRTKLTFNDRAKAETEVRRLRAQHGDSVKFYRFMANVPDSSADVTRQRRVNERHVGDCELATFLWLKVVGSASGFSVVGAISVGQADAQGRPTNGSGHSLGILRGPDGAFYVTSNQEFRRVDPGPDGTVDMADIEATAEVISREIYDKSEVPKLLFYYGRGPSPVAAAREAIENRAMDFDGTRLTLVVPRPRVS